MAWGAGSCPSLGRCSPQKWTTPSQGIQGLHPPPLREERGAHLLRGVLEGRDLLLQGVQASAGQLISSCDWKQRAE